MFGHAIINEKNFEISNLSDVCEYITDGSHISPKNNVNSEIPMLSVKDMTGVGFDYSNCKHISLADYALLKKNGCQPRIGDVLISKDGSYFKYAFVVSEERKEVILSSIAMIHPTNVLIPEYLKAYLLSDEVYQFVKQELVTGMALKRIILEDIKRIPVFIPKLKEQNQFALYVNSVDKLRYANVICQITE